MRIWRGQHSRTAVIGVAFVAFVVCCVLPVAYLLATTLGAPGAFAAAVALDSRQRGLLFNTALLGVGTAALATAIGAPLGIVLARVPLRRQGGGSSSCGCARSTAALYRRARLGQSRVGVGYPNGRTAYRPPSSF